MHHIFHPQADGEVVVDGRKMNEEYIPMDTVTFMDEVLNHYKSHGSREEQIRINYIMGCIYRDRGDSPMALEYYLNAVNLADTTANDCDFKKLCRIYGQIAQIYHRQRYPGMESEYWQKAAHTALKNNDTLSHIACIEYSAGSYHLRGDFEKASQMTKEAYWKYKNVGHDRFAAATLGYMMFYYLKMDSLDNAKKVIDEYKAKSGYIDKDGNAISGKETFYYYIGLYHEKINNLDSAIYYYRKVLSYPYDIQNQEIGYRGLMSVYGKLHCIDSVMKYAQLYADANDTANMYNTAQEIVNTKALYDYSEQQRIAKTKSEEVDRLRQIGYCGIITLMIIAFGLYVMKNKVENHLRETNRIYAETLEKYIHSQRDLERSRLNHENFEKEKQKEIKALHEILAKYQEVNIEDWEGEQSIHLHESVKKMHQYASTITKPTESDWDKFIYVISDFLPDFYTHLKGYESVLSEKEFRICLFSRLCFSPSEIGVLMELSPQNVTNFRSRINKKLFGDKGTKNFNYNIAHL